MKINNKIASAVSKACQKPLGSLKKNSPELLVVAGIIGIVGSAVMACVATTKVNDVLDETKGDIDAAKNTIYPELSEEEQAAESRKAIATAYVKAGYKFVKLYGPSVLLGGASIASIVASTSIMKQRNAALAAAYSVIDSSYKDYRKRVSEKLGEEAEKGIRYGIVKHDTEESVINPETGKPKKQKKTEFVADGDIACSDYARFFDESSREWHKDAEYNLMILKGKQKEANFLLLTRGYLFLNDVYDMLDIPRSKQGQVIGWMYDPEKKEKIDFGIYNINRMKNRDFVNGYERSILLDFNVDGYILDKI